MLRVVIFRRISLLAMVEFATKEGAAAAKSGLHGRNIYPNMCTLRTEFPDKETLQVNENSMNDRWDFTVSGPPGGYTPAISFSPAGGQAGGMGGGPQYGQLAPRYARKYLLDSPASRPWKEKTELPDKILRELSKV